MIKRTHIVFFVATFILLVHAITARAEMTCKNHINSINYFVDYSGSMMMENPTLNEPKLNLAKEIILKMNGMMPEIPGLQVGLYTFAPYSAIVPQTTWIPCIIPAGVRKLNSDLEVFARFTTMGDGVQAFSPEIAKMKSSGVVLLISDGENNHGLDPVEEVRKVYQANPDICFHIISLADTAEGKAVLEKIAALNCKSILVDGVCLLQQPTMLRLFIQSVFCQVSFALEEVAILQGVNFAVESWALDRNAEAILTETAKIINSNEQFQVRLLGWTDSFGTDEYNLKLSERRANAVKEYLVSQGIAPSRIMAKGMGESFRYNNKTSQGRFMNRRTEVIFFN